MEMKSLITRLTSLEKQPLNEGAKPDFLDMDKDGNKKEPMKKAVADKKKPGSDKVKKESLGRIAEALMKDMGYDLYEYGAGSGDPFAANQMDYDAQMANGKKNLDWIKKQLGMGQEQPTPEPNIAPPYRPSPSPFVPDPTGLDGAGGDNPRPTPRPSFPIPSAATTNGKLNPNTKCVRCGTPYSKHFRFDPAGDPNGKILTTTIRGLCGNVPEDFPGLYETSTDTSGPRPSSTLGPTTQGNNNPIPRVDPAVIANNSEYDTAVKQGQDPNRPYPTPGPTPRPPVTTQRKNPLYDPKVEAFQKELIKKGAKINLDGVYGPETNRAAQQFGMAPPPGIKTTRDAGGSTPNPKSSTPPGKTNSGKATPPVATQRVTPDGKPPADADKSQPYWVDGTRYKWLQSRGGGSWTSDFKPGDWGWNSNQDRANSGYTGPDKEPVQTQPYSTQMSTMPPPKVSSVREDAELTAMLRIAGLR